ncbi:MAG: TetR/AcrR family transcriptional regulator [Phenylobacterium sp.]|uniref:TetR/AcrR family transcriptional regulator n=1 Tax=Phenylobacterium sp. TaxID=1871053 RepID=UPI00391BEAFA
MTDQTPPDVSGFMPPRQKRSEATLARIFDGAMSLLATRELSSISMEEIAGAAGVSVGAIYRRFKSRQTLLDELLRGLQARQLAVLEEALSPDLWRGVGLEARLDWIVARQAEAAARAPGFIRAVFGRVTGSVGALDDEAVRLNTLAVEQLAQWLLQCEGEIRTPNPEATARVAVAQLSISLHLAALYPATFAPAALEDVSPILKAIALKALTTE